MRRRRRFRDAARRVASRRASTTTTARDIASESTRGASRVAFPVDASAEKNPKRARCARFRDGNDAAAARRRRARATRARAAAASVFERRTIVSERANAAPGVVGKGRAKAAATAFVACEVKV